MTNSIANLIAVKKMQYRTCIDGLRPSRRGYTGRGGFDARSDFEHTDTIIEYLELQQRAPRLLAEIQYLETHLEDPFEKVSFLVTDQDARQMECME